MEQERESVSNMSSTQYTCLGCNNPITEGFVFVGSYRVYPHDPSPIVCHSNNTSMFEFSIRGQYTRGSCSYNLRIGLSITADLEGRIIHSSELEKTISDHDCLEVNEPDLNYFKTDSPERRSSTISRRTRRIASALRKR